MNEKIHLKEGQELDLLPEQRKGDPRWYVCIRDEESGKIIKEYSFVTEEEGNDFIDAVMEENGG